MIGRLLLALVLASGVVHAHEGTYPMTPAAYRKEAELRLQRYRERIEQHMTAQRFDDPRRVAVRTRLATLESTLRARIDKLAADGAISKADAEDVKQLGKQGRAAIYKDFGLEADDKPKKPT